MRILFKLIIDYWSQREIHIFLCLEVNCSYPVTFYNFRDGILLLTRKTTIQLEPLFGLFFFFLSEVIFFLLEFMKVNFFLREERQDSKGKWNKNLKEKQ